MEQAISRSNHNAAEGGCARLNGARSEASVKTVPVSWMSLPRKDQLLILTLARLAEPLLQASLQAYMFFMLKSFDSKLSDTEVSRQAGLLTGSFTAAQCITAVWWGNIADKEWMGRKRVILVGLAGSLVSSIGFGFSRSYRSAMIFRVIGGALNGNVGVLRTMISEIIKQKRFQPKAFLILPMTFNVGILVGPLLGGWLQHPVDLYPKILGPGTRLGGSNGVQWMITFPYALPNILNALLFALSILLVLFGLEETLADRAHCVDRGLRTGRWLIKTLQRLLRWRTSFHYSPLIDAAPFEVELSSRVDQHAAGPRGSNARLARPRPKLPYKQIFTHNVILVMISHGLMHVHISAFNNLWFIFLSTPRFDPRHPTPSSHIEQKFPFEFTGGLGLDPPTIGFALGIVGIIGLALQFGIYSRMTNRLGIVMSFRFALLVTFPLVYALIPYLVMIPTKSPTPNAADGVWIWTSISALLSLQVLGRTFVLPIAQILVNNCTPHPSVLGSVHGIGQSVSSGSRTLGPVLWSYLYGLGLDMGKVGLAWWILSLEAIIVAATSWLLRDGSGHEIYLEGDED